MKSTFASLFIMFAAANLHGIIGITGFTAEELKFFESLSLCERFGGACGPECPFRFITHKWGIPLCPVSGPENLQCCIGPPVLNETQETEKLTTTTTLPETTTTTPPPAQEYNTCGKFQEKHSRRKRIVGGQAASPGSWPWLVSFRSLLGLHTCSGAVITQRWVISAAHCFKFVSNPSLWRVKTGEYSLLHSEADERELLVQEIILHPGYKARLKNDDNNNNLTLHAKYVHDIALVRLADDARTEPICLPLAEGNSFVGYRFRDREHGSDVDKSWGELSNEVEGGQYYEEDGRNNDNSMYKYNRIPNMGFRKYEGEQNSGYSVLSRRGTCWVTGWGKTMDASAEDEVLQEVSGDVIGSEACSHMWGTQLEDDMVCFGDGTYGPCAGDSGGPLSCERDGHFYLAGVVSWGTEECNISGYPSVFTNTRPYLSWIHEQLNKHL